MAKMTHRQQAVWDQLLYDTWQTTAEVAHAAVVSVSHAGNILKVLQGKGLVRRTVSNQKVKWRAVRH